MSDPISQHGVETLAEIFVDTATLTTRAFMPRLLRGQGAVVSMEGGDIDILPGLKSGALSAYR